MPHLIPKNQRRLLGALLATVGACVPVKLDLFDSDATGDASATTTAGATESAGPPTATTSDPVTTGLTSGGPAGCDDPIADCADDQDRDGHADVCDNAPAHTNPDQSDIDLDGIGDVVDRCPTLPSSPDLGDLDSDGIGDACDLCPQLPAFYNHDGAPISGRMKVRNIPQVEDSDHDGIGDACDNCVRTPNCQGYGDGLAPYGLGDPIDREAADCQADLDLDQIGDACVGTTLPGAAGPVGFAPKDDFDQDGLNNDLDKCPRQPVALQTCDGDDDCPDAAICSEGVCNHRDSDGDDVGDICDTCPWNPNPQQIQLGQDEENDLDRDFVGSTCEAGPMCIGNTNPRAFGFYDGSVGGYCCVRLFDGGTVLDPHGDPVALPANVLATPGVGVLPPGCTEEAQPLDPADGWEALWAGFCLLPQVDQDLDGHGDVCDLCRFAFDPEQEVVELDGTPGGKYCNGEFAPGELDPAMMCLPGT